MYLYCAVVLALIINGNAAKPHKEKSSEHVVGSSGLKTDEVAKLIYKINEENHGVEKAALRDAFKAHQGTQQDHHDTGARPAKENPSLADIIALVKSLNVGGVHDHDANDDIRIHVIKNPDVLQEYKEQLAKKQVSTTPSFTSFSSGETDFQLKLSKLLRRNAVFRVDKFNSQINEDKPALRMGSERDYKTKNSREKNHVKHFDRNDDDKKDKSRVTFKNNKNDGYGKDKKSFIDTSNRKKDRYKDDKKDDWDTVVQKYDKWNSKNNDNFAKKSKYNDDSKNNDKYKEKSNMNDKYKNDHNRNDEFRDETNRNDKYNEDRKRNDKYNDDTIRKDKYNDEPKKTDKYNDRYNDHNWNDNGSPKKKSVDERDEPKEIKVYGNKKNDWDEPKESKLHNDKKDFWDEPKVSKPYDIKKDSWDEPKKTIDSKKDESWDNWKSKSMEKADKDRKKQKSDDWNKPMKKDIVEGSYERKKDDNKGSFDLPAYKESRDTGGWNKKFVPKISNYYNPRPRIQEHAERPGFKPFGRTSIPFVGKKGIYEEEMVK